MAVERGKEIVRQWHILRGVATARDWSVSKLAREHRVSKRTIYRDLAALQAAGFPLYNDEHEGTVYWRLESFPFPHLHGTGFTFPELCAFYIHRGRLSGPSGLPLADELAAAMKKVLDSLTPTMKEYLDKLSKVICWKAEAPAPKPGPVAPDALVKATLEHRRIVMRYRSFSSGRVKEYTVEPYRVTAGNGALYLYAYVPIYGAMRTFALQRIERLRVLEELFDPAGGPMEEPHGTSIGIGSGTPELVEVLIAPKLAPYIEERRWHESQELTRQPDGSLVVRFRVAIDTPLRSWILGWGHMAQVLAPSRLASEILEELQEASEHYAPRIPFELQPAINEPPAESSLPFLASKVEGRPSKTAAKRQSGRQPGGGAGGRDRRGRAAV
jgi:proteasome accessory factor B